MKIPYDVLVIMNTLAEAGYEAYAVGGCVRDSLLLREPKDWDITTNALPEAVKALFRRTVDTGIEHGTVTVMRGKTGYEVTTYRLDGAYSDGRHPDSVTFTPELREDLRRRDFTINAMACAADGTLVDLFGGQDDLAGRVVRCVGDPDERFTEDALRILRAVRFSAQLDFEIEPETWEALRRHAPNLVHVSRERILAELTKTLLSEHPERLSGLGPAGILPWLPERFSECRADRRAAGLPGERSIRWAAVFAESAPEAVRDLLKELKSDRDTIDRAALLVREVKKPLPETAAEVRILLSEIGPERFADLILLKKAGYGTDTETGCAGSGSAEGNPAAGQTCPDEDPAAERIRNAETLAAEILSRDDCISLKQLALTGRDLIALGVKPGPELGQKLAFLFRKVLEQPELNEKETLKKLLAETQG